MENRPTQPFRHSKKQELNNNAMSVPSITDVAYPTLNGIAFAMPEHPGPAPTTHLAVATAVQITETNRQYAFHLSEHDLVSKLNNALKAQLLTAVNDIYVAQLSDATMGYTNVTVRQLLAHSKSTYGVIPFTQLGNNFAQLDIEFNPDEPLEVLWQCVKECRHFAASGNDPISEITAVRKTLSVLLEKTGVFSDSIRDWCKHADADWTWLGQLQDRLQPRLHRTRTLPHSRQVQAADRLEEQAISTATAALTAATNNANNQSTNHTNHRTDFCLPGRMAALDGIQTTPAVPASTPQLDTEPTPLLTA
jgi:hypothetical protein